MGPIFRYLANQAMKEAMLEGSVLLTPFKIFPGSLLPYSFQFFAPCSLCLCSFFIVLCSILLFNLLPCFWIVSLAPCSFSKFSSAPFWVPYSRITILSALCSFFLFQHLLLAYLCKKGMPCSGITPNRA